MKILTLIFFALQTLGLLQAAEEKPDLTINYVIIGALLLVAVILAVVVGKRPLICRLEMLEGRHVN